MWSFEHRTVDRGSCWPMHASRTKIHFFSLLLGISCLVLTGCGYRNPYVQPHVATQAAKSVYLSIWPNRTNELGLETAIYRNLVSWFQQSPHITITSNKADADFLLSGEISAINIHFNGRYDQAVEVNVVLTVSYQLTEKANNTILLEKTDLTFAEAARIGADASTTRANKNKALSIINEDLAELVYLDTMSSLFPL